jgi:hypothetical protein
MEKNVRLTPRHKTDSRSFGKNGFCTSPIYCGHANEAPSTPCDCLKDCYCRAPGNTCHKEREFRRVEKQIADKLDPKVKVILLEAFTKAFGKDGTPERERACRKLADGIGKALQQQYEKHKGRWWLWALGKPARPLTPQEIKDARTRGLIR